jgi:hypothetical protein
MPITNPPYVPGPLVPGMLIVADILMMPFGKAEKTNETLRELTPRDIAQFV